MRVVVSRVIQVGVVGLLATAVVLGYRATHEKPVPPPSISDLGGGPAPTLGPTGLGKLSLGMTEEQANATGVLKVPADWKTQENVGNCLSLGPPGANAFFSRHHGLAILAGADTVTTPEGIRAGATVDQVAAAYPKLEHPDLGTAREQVQLVGDVVTPVPGNPKALYVFIFHAGGVNPDAARLGMIFLSLRDQDSECTKAG
jgi:hypothetical protein